MVYRIYVEKKPGFDGEAQGLFHELVDLLGITRLKGLRLITRYDVEGTLQGDPSRLEHPIKTQIIRIVPLHSLGSKRQGIHRSDLCGFRRNGRQIRQHRFFVRDGHIAASEPLWIFLDKRGDLFRFPFQEPIGILRAQGSKERLMDLGRQAVPQYPSQQSKFHDSFSSFP